MDDDALVAAGLYDPEDPDAEERLELLHHLVERGAGLDLIRRRLEVGDELFMVATSLTREWPPLRSARQLASEAGADVEAVARMRMAMGFPVPDLDEPTARHTLAEDVGVFQMASELYGEDRVLAFTRVVGSAAWRIADAANALFSDGVGDSHDHRPSLLELSQANEVALGALEQVPPLLGRAVIEHLQAMLARIKEVIGQGTTRCAVGFVDLVGSSAWAATVPIHDHGQALARFETAAWETATRHGGRIVKMIGDEAMFVADSVGVAARIASGITRAADADDALPAARGAVGWGEVVTRAGDYFGPLVNAVSRATKEADPGQVVVLAPADGQLRDEGWQLGGTRTVELRGIVEPAAVTAIIGHEPGGRGPGA